MIECRKYKGTDAFERLHSSFWALGSQSPDGVHDCSVCEFHKDCYRMTMDELKGAHAGQPTETRTRVVELFNRARGRFVRTNGGGDVALLVGVFETIEDCYWLFVDKDVKCRFDSCVGGWDMVFDDGEELPNDISVLKWLRDNRPEELHDVVSEILRGDYLDVPLVGEIVVRPDSARKI